MNLAEALAKIDGWTRASRAVKVVFLSPLAGIDDSGWGGALSIGPAQLRVLYRRDSDKHEVDAVIDLADATASGSSIWDAPAPQQQKFGHFDEVVSLSLVDGRTVLLMCATPSDVPAH